MFGYSKKMETNGTEKITVVTPNPAELCRR